MAASSISENRKRIAKNTLVLYFRMLVLMVIGLFTSRVVLRALGVEDYGIYGAVAGVVTLCTVFTGTMSSAISRFITFELGRGGKELHKVFSTAVSIQLLLSALIIILGESLGLWWLNHKMVIPAERLLAARWVFQFSILSLVIQLISVPYNAEIIAHERMDAFAWITIAEGVGKLALAYCVSVSSSDKLILYAAMIALVSLMTRLLYGLFCRRHFPEVRYDWILDKSLFGRMFSFAGWNFIGSGAAILREQGGNLLLNLFFGLLVNAAWQLASQIYASVQKFVTSFAMAINPQITKSYAADDRDYCYRLVFNGSKLSVFLLLMVALPVIFFTPFLTELWLGAGQVPEHMILFTRLTIICLIIDSVSGTMITLINATGDIRNYQLLVGGIFLLNVPCDYVLLKMGMPAYVIYIVAIVLAVCCLFARLWMLKRQLDFPVLKFLWNVVGNEVIVTLVAAAIPFALRGIHPIAGIAITLTWTALAVYFIGLDSAQRKELRSKLLKR